MPDKSEPPVDCHDWRTAATLNADHGSFCLSSGNLLELKAREQKGEQRKEEEPRFRE